jgi:hypothetical protein
LATAEGKYFIFVDTPTSDIGQSIKLFCVQLALVWSLVAMPSLAMAGFFYSTGYYSPSYTQTGRPFTYFNQPGLLSFYPSAPGHLAAGTTSAMATTPAPATAAAPAPVAISTAFAPTTHLVNYPSFALQPSVYYPTYSTGCRNVFGSPVPCALPYGGPAANVVLAEAAAVAEMPAAVESTVAPAEMVSEASATR